MHNGTLVGRLVNGHEITRFLGAGGMGEVYVARHQHLGTQRVVKVIHDDVKQNPGIAKRFHREALVLGRLRHPGIVDVIDYGHLENGWPFLILEFVEGGDLEALLNRSGPLSLQAGLDVLLQLARVLEYAHAQGVVHRDLKPGNILLRSGDHRLVKVIDFGLAKLMSAEMLTRLTTDGQIMGSPHYMAPEQAMGLPDISGAADIYALAGIAYVVMSGRPVFDSDSPLGLVFAQARHQPERLAQRVQVPAELDELLHACLAKNPQTRPAASDLVLALGRLLIQAGGHLSSHFSVSTPVASTAAVASTSGAALPVEGVLSGSLVRASSATPPVGPFNQDSQLVSLSKSLARERVVASAADYIFAPTPHGLGDLRRVREALQRQMLAVVGELAEALAPAEPSIASRRDSLQEIARQLSDLELNAALLDDDLVAADDDRRVEFEEQRFELARRTLALRRRLDSEQRELVVVVDRIRGAALPDTAPLYGELDEMITRVRALDGSRG